MFFENPLNINTIYIIHTYTVGFSALIANSFLLWVIWKKTPMRMKIYGHVLLQNCLADVWFIFVSCFFIFQFQASDGRLFLRNAAPWIPIYGYFPCISFWTAITSIICSYWSLYFEIFYRYFTIVHFVTLTPGKTWFLFISSCAFFALFTWDYSFAFCSNHNSSFNAVLKEQAPWKFMPFLESFRSLDFYNVHAVVFLTMLCALTCLFNFLYAYCYYKLIRAVKSATLSIHAVQMQKRLNRRSLMQAFTPIIGVSTFAVMFVLVSTDNGNSYQLLLMMSALYLPLLNPIITILTIYRKLLRKKQPNIGLPISRIASHSRSIPNLNQ